MMQELSLSLWVFISILWTECSGAPFVTVNNRGDGTTRVTCGGQNIFNMQWNVLYSDENTIVGWETIDFSTRVYIVIAEGITLSSMYITPDFQSFNSIESVMIIGRSFKGAGPIVFTCSGLTGSPYYGPFTIRETVLHQGLAQTTSMLPNTDPRHMATDVKPTTTGVPPSTGPRTTTPGTNPTTSVLPITPHVMATDIHPTTSIFLPISGAGKATSSNSITVPSPQPGEPNSGEDNPINPTDTSPTDENATNIFSRQNIMIISIIGASTGAALIVLLACAILVLYSKCKRSKSKKTSPDSLEETNYDYPYQDCEVYGTRPTNPVFELVHDQGHVEIVTEMSQNNNTALPMMFSGHENECVLMTQNAAYSAIGRQGNGDEQHNNITSVHMSFVSSSNITRQDM